MIQKRTVTVIGVLLLMGAGARFMARLRAPALPDHTSTDTGDPALASRVREVFAPGRGYRGVAVALIEADGTATFAGVGTSGDPARPTVDENTRFEIASVTKGLTGMLIAEQVRRGQASLGDRLAGATLAELATHRSGLPCVDSRSIIVEALCWLRGANPYRGDPAWVLRAALDAKPEGAAEPLYSNLGAAVAGNLVAERAGVAYPGLLTERVLAPLGMDATTIVTVESELPTSRAHGSNAWGVGCEPWMASGWAPAGVGVWSTSSDLARLIAALADGTAPGVSATQPSTRLSDDEEIGLFWITSHECGRQVTWHNGGTGGSRSFVGFERTTGRGIVVLANTDAPVDAQALTLLLEDVP